MSMLHHDKINLLKMDIERHEFDVFKTLQTFPDQIVFETHLHNAYGMFGRPVSEQEWSAMWKKLEKYNVFSYEPNPFCLCCCEWSIVNSDVKPVRIIPQVIIDNEYVQIRDNCEGSVQTSIPHGDFGPNEYIVFIEGPTLHAFIPKWSSK